MRSLTTKAAFLTLATSGFCVSALAAPLRIVPDDAKLGTVLYRHGGAALVADADGSTRSSADFTDVFAVNLHGVVGPVAQIADSFGEVLAEAPGNFAVVRVAPENLAELAGQLHRWNNACGSIVKLDGKPVARAMRAAPVPVVPIAGVDPRVAALVAQVEATRLRASIAELAAFGTRYNQADTGKAVAQKLADKYTALAVGRDDVEVTTYDHGSSQPQKSLVVRIKGASRPDEVIVLGSHIDSINLPWSYFSPDISAPGADDNASGTATNLEIFRILMASGAKLERTLEIHGYAAEELGLLGSADIADDYAGRHVNVVSMMQLDMTAYKASGAEDKIYFVTNDSDPAFVDQLATLVTGYTGLPFGKESLPQGSSDHASWRKHGFSTAFPFENPKADNPKIHSSDDTLNVATAMTLAQGFGKLGVAYVAHFGGLL